MEEPERAQRQRPPFSSMLCPNLVMMVCPTLGDALCTEEVRAKSVGRKRPPHQHQGRTSGAFEVTVGGCSGPLLFTPRGSWESQECPDIVRRRPRPARHPALLGAAPPMAEKAAPCGRAHAHMRRTRMQPCVAARGVAQAKPQTRWRNPIPLRCAAPHKHLTSPLRERRRATVQPGGLHSGSRLARPRLSLSSPQYAPHGRARRLRERRWPNPIELLSGAPHPQDQEHRGAHRPNNAKDVAHDTEQRAYMNAEVSAVAEVVRGRHMQR